MEALKTAVEANSLEGVYAALKQLGTNENITEYMIETAVQNRNLEMVAALLGARSRQADATSMSHWTLVRAITAKDLPITKLLIRAGYEPFSEGVNGTALHWAAETGDLPLLEYIWEVASSRGISINVRGYRGWTPLHTAAYHLNDAAVRFLLERGANPNALSNDDAYGSTAFTFLLQNGHSSKPENAEKVQRITEAFVSAGLRLEEFTFHNMTPLMQASRYGVAVAVKALLSAGANINTLQPDDGETALYIAIQLGKFDCAQVLISAGADVNARDAAGNTPLHLACYLRYNNAEERVKQVLMELINHGAGVNAKNSVGETPVHAACKNIRREGAIDVLLEYGADLSILAAGNASCLHLVVRALCERCQEGLPWDEHRVKVAKQHAACALGFIQRLLKAGVKADARNLDRLTPIALLKELLGAAVLNQHKAIFAPIIVALIKGGDFSRSWSAVPHNCPGLGSAIEVLWNKRPEMLCYLFAKLSPDEQGRVKMTLRCLQRYLPSEEVRMEIIFNLDLP